MSWEGNYWGPDGSVAKAKKKFESSEETLDDRISYASVLYSAAGRAWVELKCSLKGPNLAEVIVWLFRTVTLGRSSVRHVDCVWRERHVLEPTLNQIDVSLSVWSRFAVTHFGWRKEVIRSIMLLRLFDRGQYDSDIREQKVLPHTRAFLLSHAMTLGHVERTKERVQMIEHLAEESEKIGELAQASRVWRHAGGHYQKLYGWRSELAEQVFARAMRIADASSPDQVAKLGGKA